MTRQMTATELKATLLAVLDEVADGEDVEVTKRGRLIAKLVPIKSPATLMGRFEEIASSSSDVDEDLFSTGEAWEVDK